MRFPRPKPLLRILAVAAMTLGAADLCHAQNNGGGQQQQQGGRRQRGQNGQNGGQGGQNGQRRMPMGMMEVMRLNRALDALTLTDDQKAKVEKLRESARQEMGDMREELRDLPPEEARAKVKVLVDDTKEKLKSILTPEQQEELKKKLEAAATQPAEQGAQSGPGGGRGGMAMDRLKENLAKLDLTDEQKTKTDKIVADAEEAVKKLREEAQGNPQAVREKAMALMTDTQAKLKEVLTEEQQTKLRELSPRRGGPGGGGNNGGANNGGGNNGPPAGGDMKGPPAGGDMKGPPGGGGPDNGPPPPPDNPQRTQLNPHDSAPANAGSVSSAAAFGPATAPTKAEIGKPAPAFTLKSLERKIVTAASLRGRPTAIVFGSYSSPLFRDKAAAFAKLEKQYRGRATVVFVYTREAYARNEWDVERNRDDKIQLEQPGTLEDRIKNATSARDTLKLSGDVVVDDVDDAVATNYQSLQGGCVVLDAAGMVVSLQKWAEPFATRQTLDALLKKP